MASSGQAALTSLHSACLHLLRVARSVDRHSGLSPARLSVLSVLVFGGPRTVGALAHAEEVRSPTMTALVNHLEGDGLVRRRVAKADQRQVLVQATPAGHRVMRQAQSRRIELLEQLFSGLSDKEIRTLARAAGLMDTAVRQQLEAVTGADR